jgi:hypothetical protein
VGRAFIDAVREVAQQRMATTAAKDARKRGRGKTTTQARRSSVHEPSSTK